MPKQVQPCGVDSKDFLDATLNLSAEIKPLSVSKTATVCAIAAPEEVQPCGITSALAEVVQPCGIEPEDKPKVKQHHAT